MLVFIIVEEVLAEMSHHAIQSPLLTNAITFLWS